MREEFQYAGIEKRGAQIAPLKENSSTLELSGHICVRVNASRYLPVVVGDGIHHVARIPKRPCPDHHETLLLKKPYLLRRGVALVASLDDDVDDFCRHAFVEHALRLDTALAINASCFSVGGVSSH